MIHAIAVSLLAVLMTLIVTAGPASAARILYVAGSGIDTAGCGTASRPCRNLAHVIALASAGDRILVGPGTYEGFLLEKRVTLESTHGAGATIIQPTVIEGNTFGIDVAPGADGTVIGKPSKGFTIRGEDYGVHVNAPDVVVEDNIVPGGLLGISTTFSATRLTLMGNLIVVSGSGSFGSGAAGVIARGQGTTIVQNVIQGERTAPGVLLFAEDSVLTDNVITGAFEGILVRSATTTIRRNTFVANAAGLWFEAPAGNPGVVVTSNNFLGNDAGGGNCGLVNAGTTVVVAGNYWGSATGPGDDPADDVCGMATVTTPFLRAPVTVGAPAGR